MTKSLLTALVLAGFVAGPSVTALQAASPADQVAQASQKEDCSKIENQQARIACMKRQSGK